MKKLKELINTFNITVPLWKKVGPGERQRNPSASRSSTNPKVQWLEPWVERISLVILPSEYSTPFNMTMMLSELQSVANKWFEAFNDHNIEQLLSLYDENAQHYSPKLKIRHPETNGFINGKKALRVWWQDAFNRLPTLNYELVRLTPYENRVFMEYVRRVQGEEDLYVGEMLEIENGKITTSSVFHR